MAGLQILEEWMLTTITHPHGVLAGTFAASGQCSIPSLTSIIHATTEWSAEDRVGVYWNAYFARLQDCLHEDFPVLRQAVGDAVFDEFAFEYLQIHPPTSYTLCRLGSQFPAFLKASRPPREREAPDWADFIADLAAFEWTLSEVFDGPGLEQLEICSATGLNSVSPDRLLDVKVVCAPCLRLENYRFPVHRFHAALKSGDTPDWPKPQASFVAVTRRAFTVQHHTLNENEFTLLQRLMVGDSLGLALEHVCGANQVLVAEVRTHIASWFQSWMQTGLVMGLSDPHLVSPVDDNIIEW
jgi:hypothetical protein